MPGLQTPEQSTAPETPSTPPATPITEVGESGSEWRKATLHPTLQQQLNDLQKLLSDPDAISQKMIEFIKAYEQLTPVEVKEIQLGIRKLDLCLQNIQAQPRDSAPRLGLVDTLLKLTNKIIGPNIGKPPTSPESPPPPAAPLPPTPPGV